MPATQIRSKHGDNVLEETRARFWDRPENEIIWTALSHSFFLSASPPVFLLLHAVFLVLQWKVGKLITEK